MCGSGQVSAKDVRDLKVNYFGKFFSGILPSYISVHPKVDSLKAFKEGKQLLRQVIDPIGQRNSRKPCALIHSHGIVLALGNHHNLVVFFKDVQAENPS